MKTQIDLYFKPADKTINLGDIKVLPREGEQIFLIDKEIRGSATVERIEHEISPRHETHYIRITAV